MRLIPMSDHLIVRPLEQQPQGAVLLPQGVECKAQLGKVLSVGDGRLLPCGRRAPMEVHEGDRVLFSSEAGEEILFNGQALKILRQEDVLAVL